jgi:hypothetical protein
VTNHEVPQKESTSAEIMENPVIAQEEPDPVKVTDDIDVDRDETVSVEVTNEPTVALGESVGVTEDTVLTGEALRLWKEDMQRTVTAFKGIQRDLGVFIGTMKQPRGTHRTRRLRLKGIQGFQGDSAAWWRVRAW